MTVFQTNMPEFHFSETLLPGGEKPSLFLRSAVVAGKTKADVLLTHGLGEHSGRYGHVARFFAESGYRLCTYDLRGHGRSHGRRGHIKRYGELLDDLEMALGYHRREGVPMFLYGHSLGGQITLNYLLQRRPRVPGAIITSPWLELAFRPRRMKVLLAKLMVELWPTFTQTTPNDQSLLSRDLAFLASLPGQDLVHHKVSARMYQEMLAGADRVCGHTSGFGCPLFLIHGEADPLTSAAATASFFKKLDERDKTLKIHPGMRHETQNETGRETVLAEMVEWMDRRLPAGPGGV